MLKNLLMLKKVGGVYFISKRGEAGSSSLKLILNKNGLPRVFSKHD